uniref:Morc6_S5 domain-containing protein n=1 Tax=Caenorhabditis tropicalis TaxID=1561998 RepID=A0A1I7TD31_9PELO
MMSVPLGMEFKLAVLDLSRHWYTVSGVDKNSLAVILQSLHILDIGFNEIFVIRTSIYNYLTKPSINEEAILIVLPSGKIELHPRGHLQFHEIFNNEHAFILRKLQKVVATNPPSKFCALRQYDFGLCIQEERSHQITKTLSCYVVSGFYMGEGKTCFGSGFGRTAVSRYEQRIKLAKETHSYNSVLDVYRDHAQWIRKIELRALDEEVKNRFEINSVNSEESSEEDEEIEEEHKLHRSYTSSDESSENGQLWNPQFIGILRKLVSLPDFNFSVLFQTDF